MPLSVRWTCSATRRARGISRGIGASRAPRDLDAGVALDLVAAADVVVVANPDAALRTGAHFADIVLEAAQRIELALVDHDVVAQHAHRVAALDVALDDQ